MWICGVMDVDMRGYGCGYAGLWMWIWLVLDVDMRGYECRSAGL